MNFVYSEKSWGRSIPKLLESQLRGNEAILHSASSNLYGAVDNDDVYQWMGGLRVASQAAGAKPELFINNMRRAGDEKIEEARHFIAAELNSRNWNPQWISEMQKEGYSGARIMMNSVEYLYGWQATAPESISPTVWKKTYDVYVADEYGLGMNRFFETSNPAAKQVLIARLLEVDRQGTYQFTADERALMVKDYVRLVNRFGVACSANICGNPRLQSAVLAEARKAALDGFKPGELEQFRRRFQDAARAAFASRSTTAASTVSPAKPFRIFQISAEEFAKLGSAAKRIIEENMRLLAVTGLVIVLIGSLVAFGKRRPVEWSELHLKKGSS
jgi:cobaltochelatase CobN